MGSGQRGIFRELGWHKDQMTSSAWGSPKDTTKKVSPRPTHEGRSGFSMPDVKGVLGKRHRVESPGGMRGMDC